MFDRSSTLPRRALAGTAPPALLALRSASLGAGSAQAERPDPLAGATSAREAPGPIHAGNTFGWYGHGGLVYDETFVGPLNHKRWRVEGPGAVRTQHGMLTLNTANKGSVSAQMTIPGRAYGRWETRLRQRQYGHKYTPYRVLTELVPVTDGGRGLRRAEHRAQQASRWPATRSTSTSAPAPTTSSRRR